MSFEPDSVTSAAQSGALYADLQHRHHVWFCESEGIDAEQARARYLPLLSAHERARWQGFVFDDDRQTYLLAHAMLRCVLSRYAEPAPQDWCFQRGEHGRPELQRLSAVPPLYFNLSHTRGLSACVVSRVPRCGVDVERLSRRSDLAALARRMFAPPECEALFALEPAAQRQRFFEYWTLREAYVKALGCGLAGSSQRFYFEVDRTGAAQAAIRLCAQEADAEDWGFNLLSPVADSMLAVAVQHGGAGGAIHCRAWQP